MINKSVNQKYGKNKPETIHVDLLMLRGANVGSGVVANVVASATETEQSALYRPISMHG